MDFYFMSGMSYVIVNIIFVIVAMLFVGIAINGIKQWNKNNKSPHLIVDAKVVSKRKNVSHNRNAVAGDNTGAHGYHTTTSTSYYVTFQVESGDRIEFHMSGSDYGMISEGDLGKLSFQGTRFLGFERII